MAFFDKLGETISSKSKDVAKMARDMAEVASLNSKVNSSEEAIRKVYLEIGQKYYEKYKLDETNEFGLECEKITKEFEEIQKIKSEIQAIKNVKICSKCGAEEAAEALFCSKCGFQFEVEQNESSDSTEEADSSNGAADSVENLCPNCNNVIEGDMKFCNNCGHQVKE